MMMMMMMNRRITAILILFFLTVAVKGQDTDFGAWYELKADYKIIKGLRVDFEGSLRTDQNASHIETFYFEPGLRYKVNDYFSAGLYYRFIEQREDDEEFYPRHRYFMQMKGSLPVGRFTLSARYRLQTQIKTYIERAEDELPAWYNRYRLELDYDIAGLPLRPYASAEAYTRIFLSNDIPIEKMRYIFGLDYTFNKNHTFGISYIFNTSKITKPAKMNIVAVSYGIKL